MRNDYYCILKNGVYNILNSKTKRIFEVDKEGFQILKKYLSKYETFTPTHEESEFLRVLNSERSKYVKFEENKKILHLQWHITACCNLRCTHCYQEEYSAKSNLDLNGLIALFDNYCNLLDHFNMLPEISLTGGEPLSCPYFFDLVDYIRSKRPNTRINILSNGTLINEKIVSKLLKYRILGIQISLDGHNVYTHDKVRGSGSFRKAVSAIELLKKNNINVSVHCVLFKSNIDFIEDFVKLCSKLKTDRLTFSRYVPFGSGKNNKIEMIEPPQMKQIYQLIYNLKFEYPDANINLGRDFWQIIDCNHGSTCPVGDCTLTILNDGSVLPCRRLPIYIGNAVKDDLTKIFFRSKVMDIMQKNSVKECSTCDLIDTCKAGCQGIAFSYFGVLMEKADPQCWKLNNKLPPVKDNFHLEYNIEQGIYILPDEKLYYKNLLKSIPNDN